jgi:hypothetical protein
MCNNRLAINVFIHTINKIAIPPVTKSDFLLLIQKKQDAFHLPTLLCRLPRFLLRLQ